MANFAPSAKELYWDRIRFVKNKDKNAYISVQLKVPWIEYHITMKLPNLLVSNWTVANITVNGYYL